MAGSSDRRSPSTEPTEPSDGDSGPDRPIAELEPAEVARQVRAALARRASLAHADFPVRLFDRGADGIPRLIIERYGAAIRVSGGPEKASLLPAIRDALGDPPELFHRFGHLAMGGPDEGRRVVVEQSLKFEVGLLPHRNTGLFLDAREARRWVRAHAEGRRILNLFAYTCAFGVAAASGGARATTNVDAVPSTLEKGRRNYELNGLRHDGRTFLKSDVLEALKRARKSKGAFDGIVLHPPPLVTGGDRGRRTDGAKDFEKLVTACRDVLAPGGWLLVAWTATELPEQALTDAVGLGGPREIVRSGEDFTVTAEQPALRALAYFAP